MQPANDTWRLGTIGRYRANGDEISVYCGNHRCSRNVPFRRRTREPGPYPPHGETLDLTKLDPYLYLEDVVPRLGCRFCGVRKASIRISPNAPNMGHPGGDPPRPKGSF